MDTRITSPFGYFTVFGFTKNFLSWEHKLLDYLGVVPRTIDFGSAGTFFFYSSYGDLAETEEVIVLKLGFTRSPSLSPLSAQQLLSHKVVSPGMIDPQAFRGNALVAGFSKKEANFSVFKTLLSSSQLYYSTFDDGILCATGLSYLLAMLERIEMNEEALVRQFLFGAVPGPATQFRHVYRLFPGELLQWRDGKLTVDLAQDLHFTTDEPHFERADTQALDTLYERFSSVVGAYLNDIEEAGLCSANLLSGGVDSSLVQLAINEQRPSSQGRSFSYAVQVPSFEREIEYAKQAVSIFKTEHTFINISAEEFPDFFIKATKLLAQPVLTSAEVCKLILVTALAKMADSPQFFFVAQGADTLFGLEIDKKIKILEDLRRMPASSMALGLAGTLLKPVNKRGQTLLNLADILTHWDDPHHFTAPINTEASIVNFTLARRCFGDEAIRQALEDRRNLETRYLNSKDYMEKVHIMDLFNDCYEVETQSSQLFLACQKEQIYPFLDDDVIRLSLIFQPRVRYIEGSCHKFLLKKVLEQRAASPITRQPKGGSMFHADLHNWLRSGPLHEMVRDISLPGSLSRADFEKLVQHPHLSLWHLLAFDVFQKQVLQAGVEVQAMGKH